MEMIKHYIRLTEEEMNTAAESLADLIIRQLRPEEEPQKRKQEKQSKNQPNKSNNNQFKE
jgi:uncharacterized protein YwgA